MDAFHNKGDVTINSVESMGGYAAGTGWQGGGGYYYNQLLCIAQLAKQVNRLNKPRFKVIRRNGHDVFITRDNRKTWGYKHYKHCKLIAGHRDAFVATRKMRS